MVSRRTRVAFWIFRRDHPSRPKAMICSFFSSFKTFAMLREATYPPAAVNVLDVSSESMAAFQVFMYGRFWVFTEELNNDLAAMEKQGLIRKAGYEYNRAGDPEQKYELTQAGNEKF